MNEDAQGPMLKELRTGTTWQPMQKDTAERQQRQKREGAELLSLSVTLLPEAAQLRSLQKSGP